MAYIYGAPDEVTARARWPVLLRAASALPADLEDVLIAELEDLAGTAIREGGRWAGKGGLSARNTQGGTQLARGGSRTLSEGPKGTGMGKKKKARDLCLGCGGPMKPKWRGCPRCLKVRPLSAAVKSAGSVPSRVAGKAARRAVPLKVVCRNGHPTTAKGRFCTDCGIELRSTIVPPLSLVASNKGAAQFWTNYLGKSHDPAARELLWQAQHPEFRLDGGESA